MIKVANTTELKQAFNAIWETCWEEKGFEFEENPHADYFVYEEAGVKCGAFQLCDLTNLPLEADSVYLTHPTVKENRNQVVEIDKLSILKTYRGTAILPQLLVFMATYATKRNKRYFVALCEPTLFIALRRMYNVPVEKLGKPFFYKGDNVVPILIDIAQAKNQFKETTRKTQKA